MTPELLLATLIACTHREAHQHPHKCSTVIFLAPPGKHGVLIEPMVPIWKDKHDGE